VNSNLRRRNRVAADLGGLFRSQTFQVVQNERRTVVLRQAVDDLPDAAVHLVDDEPLLDRMIRVCWFGGFSEADDPRPVRGLAEMVGGDPCGDREGPRL
jgi:hypothetical protein